MAGRRGKSYREAFTGSLKVGDRVKDLNVMAYTNIDGRDPILGGYGYVREVDHVEKLYWVRFDDGHENSRGENELRKL